MNLLLSSYLSHLLQLLPVDRKPLTGLFLVFSFYLKLLVLQQIDMSE